jgi:hypothetical protein
MEHFKTGANPLKPGTPLEKFINVSLSVLTCCHKKIFCQNIITLPPTILAGFLFNTELAIGALCFTPPYL